MARLIEKIEISTQKRNKTDFRHHEQKKHAQMTFGREITLLTDVIKYMGNPFAENSKDLLVLDSRDFADPAVIDTLRQIKFLGQEQYDTCAWSTKQSPLQIQSREITYHCSAGLSAREIKSTTTAVVTQE